MLHVVSTILDEANSANENHKQTLVYSSFFGLEYNYYYSFSALKYPYSFIFKQSTYNLIDLKLEKLYKEKGWDIIVLCSPYTVFPCPIRPWNPMNLIFPFHTTNYHLQKYLPTVIKNPRFDVINWYRTITPYNYEKSCSLKHETIVNIDFFITANRVPSVLMILQNVIAITNHFHSSKKVKFVLNLPEFLLYNVVKFNLNYRIIPIETEFLRIYLKNYNVNYNSISLIQKKVGPVNLDELIRMVNKIEGKSKPSKRNVFMIILIPSLLDDICSGKNFEKFLEISKHLQLYLFDLINDNEIRHLSDIPTNCEGKIIYNRNIDIFNYDHFFEEVNRLACN